ncbi:MAG: ribonuclease D [Myxococcota bacterium]
MPFDETPLVMVETKEALDAAIEALSASKVIGIDTESDSSYAYQEKVCLIQVSDLHTDYIIDPLAIGDISALGPLLRDRSIVKVLHGADYDIVCLKRDFGFRIRGLFDTLIAAQLVGLERIGLADLIGRYFGIDIDKQYQRHNWALWPLLPEHLEYASGDTHYLLALREILLWELRKVGRTRHFREECRLLERREWQGRTFDPDGWLDMKRVNELDDDGLRVLRKLYRYRDRQARRMNRPPYKVIPDDVLIEVAKSRPESERDLDKVILRALGAAARHGKALLEETAEGLEDDSTLPRTSKRSEKRRPKSRIRTRLKGRQAERVLAELKRWRTEVLARDPSLNAYSVASNATLKWIAAVRPTNLKEPPRCRGAALAGARLRRRAAGPPRAGGADGRGRPRALRGALTPRRRR